MLHALVTGMPPSLAQKWCQPKQKHAVASFATSTTHDP